MWLETKVRMLPGFGDLAANMLTPVLLLMDGLSMIGGATKGMLLRRWSRVLVRQIRDDLGRPPPGRSINAAGVGGQEFRPAHIAWGALLQQCNDPDLVRWRHDPMVVAETLFFAYFGPLEAWCEANCVGTFYLWSDDRGVHRVFTDPTDRLLWSLTFDGSMPSMRELESLKTGG